MATFAPNEMYFAQQQQQQPSQQTTRMMAYSPPPVNGDSHPSGTVASVINHRVFVGSLQLEVTEETLKTVFEKVEPTLSIRDIKIVRESNGASKGYGFVTYDTEEEAQKIIGKPPGSFMYKGRSWNIAPAVRRFTPHPVTSGYYCYPYSPSLYSMSPSGIVGYLSPSPYMTSPMMDQSQFVFPPLTSPMMDQSQFVFPPLAPVPQQQQ